MKGLQFLPKKMHLGDNTSFWVFVDVGLEVPNHVKFPVCFYLFFLLLFVSVFPFEEIIIFSAWFPNKTQYIIDNMSWNMYNSTIGHYHQHTIRYRISCDFSYVIFPLILV